MDKELEAALGVTRREEAIAEAERDEYLDALRRLQADFDNFRKRSHAPAGRAHGARQ